MRHHDAPKKNIQDEIQAERQLGSKINLIPYNRVEGLEWSRPSRQQQERFLSIPREHGTVATLRREKGHDIDAACGQLRLQAKHSELGAGAPLAKALDH